MKKTTWAGAMAVAISLAACGGGGGDSGTSAFQPGSGTGTGNGTGSGTGDDDDPTTPGGGISTVSSGVPNQRFMSISVEKYGLDWSKDGDATTVTVRVADSAGNPVPSGTRVQFSTSGGQIVTSCTLTGVANGSATISTCSATFATQDFRPLNGLVSIVAWLEGEEAYKDLNGNGVYDTGEPFADAGRLFRDDNADGVFTDQVDELSVGATLDGAPGVGASACVVDPTVPLNNEPQSVPASCDGVWGRSFVRAAVYLPVSDPASLKAALIAARTVRVWTDFGSNDVAAPSGTTLTVVNAPDNCTVNVSPSVVPNNAVLPTTHEVSSTGAGCFGSVGVEVKFGGYSKLVTVPL
jgi:hypothetical protein